MQRRILVSALLAATIVGAGCGADPATESSARPASDSVPPPGTSLFTDAFDDLDEWGGGGDYGIGSFTHDDGAYVLTLKGAPLAGSSPSALDEVAAKRDGTLTDVVVTATVVMEQSGEVAGLFCRGYSPVDDDFRQYEFMVRDGYGAIRLADFSDPDTDARIDVVAETRDLALPTGEPITLAASCVDETDGGTALSLSVDGSQVLSASASERLPEGAPGVIVYPPPSGASPEEPVVARFLDFAVARPQ